MAYTDDYAYKLADYKQLRIPEYWIVDYQGLGGVRCIGSPKQPTVTVHAQVEGKYHGRGGILGQSVPPGR
jgi:Uma2 family endonuclease